MRILHLVTLMSPDGRYGGPVEVARQLARESVRDGHSAAIAGGRSGYGGPAPRREDGVAYRLFAVFGGRARGRFAHLVSPGLWLWWWRNVRSADVVHLHLSRDLIVAVAAMILRARTRHGGPAVIVQTHGMIVPSSSPLARLLDRVCTRPVLRAAQAVLCLDERERDRVLRVEPMARVQLLRNGVRIEPVTAEPPVTEVLFLARLHERKRPLDFVRMGERLSARWPDVRFTLVGPDGGEGDAVRAAITRSGHASISWAGAVTPGEVHDRLSAASVYVLPAVDEPFGMTVVEAMACGRPVVIAASGGLAAPVREASAGVVFDDTLEGLVAGVESLLADAELRRDLGRRARSLVERDYAVGAVGAELHRIYRTAIAERPPAVLWVTNVAAPYRVPVWRALAEACALDVALLESDDRLSADTGANRGADWRGDRVTGVSIRSLRTVRVARGEARFYGLLRMPRIRHDAVLLGGWESPAYWQLLALARLTGRRAVGFYESTEVTQQYRGGPVAAARRVYFRSLDAVVVPGVAARSALLAMGVPAENIHVGFNAVDVRAIHRAATAARTAGPRPVGGHRFIYVGRLIDLKGPDLAIAAFAQARRPGDTLTIVGTGERRSDLEGQAARLGVGEEVRFAGFRENADLPEVLGAHDTLIMPSRQDVWGLVANEALAAGLHVVLSSVAGVTESVRGMRGVFVADPEVSSLADALRTSADGWAGPIEDPEILVHDPAAFAATFLAALAPRSG